MVCCPVMKEVEAVLRRRFDAAKEAGTIPTDAQFCIKSFPATDEPVAEGQARSRDYYCVASDGQIYKEIEAYSATPTVSDYVPV